MFGKARKKRRGWGGGAASEPFGPGALFQQVLFQITNTVTKSARAVSTSASCQLGDTRMMKAESLGLW